MSTPTPYLLTRSNPHAPLREHGMRGWYHPHRSGGTAAIRMVVIHTAETDPSPASAWNVARGQRDHATVPSSYHRLVDSDQTVVTLPDSSTAFHVRGFNSPSLGLSFATRAAWWGRYPAWDRDALANAAAVAAEWSERYSIPLRWLTRQQAADGAAGFALHSTLDPARRTDPGDGFPAREFFDLIIDIIAPQEDVMSLEQEAKLDALARDVAQIKRQLGNRAVGVDLERLRLTARAHAAHDGLETEHDVPEGPVPA